MSRLNSLPLVIFVVFTVITATQGMKNKFVFVWLMFNTRMYVVEFKFPVT